MSKPLFKNIEADQINITKSISENKNDLYSPIDQQIRKLLLAHPDFFIRNQELLLKLEIPFRSSIGNKHSTNLLDKHREVLAARISTVESKYRNLVDIAKANQELSDQIHRLLCNLAHCSTLSDLIACLYAQTKTRLQLTPRIWLWHKKLDLDSTLTFSNLPVADSEIKLIANTIMPLQIFDHNTPKNISSKCNYTIALPLFGEFSKSKKAAKGLLCLINDEIGNLTDIKNQDFLLLGRFAETCARIIESHMLRL